MNGKSQARQRRSRRSRIQMRELGQTRLCVHRTSRHIYAQVIDGTGSQVLAQASTLDETLRGTNTGNKEAAAKVGTLIGERATAAGISNVAFDRSGFKYHGRVRSLAEAAREKGLVF